MLCPNCNVQLNKEEIIGKCNNRTGNKYIADLKIIWNCKQCNYFRVEFKKHITEINI